MHFKKGLFIEAAMMKGFEKERKSIYLGYGLAWP
jgi:hypothetical protein